MNYFKVFAGFPQKRLNNIIEIFKEETPVPKILSFVILAERWKIYETFDKAFTYNPCYIEHYKNQSLFLIKTK